jgi:SPOR domain
VTKESDNLNYSSKEKQGELFSEFRVSGSNKFAYFKKEMSLGRKMVLSITYENLALFFIIIIMIVVVFFSFGVERGKRLVIKNMRLWAAAHANKKAEETQVQGRGEEFDVKAADLSVKPYTIQIMAVKKIEEAQREAARLNSMGYKAFIIQSNAWYHVCAGRYANAADINNDLPVIKEKYPNCYVRKIKE